MGGGGRRSDMEKGITEEKGGWRIGLGRCEEFVEGGGKGSEMRGK